MSEELIRKSEVIEVIENLICDMEDDNDITLPVMAKKVVENMQPVNAVELPCKVGDMIYTIYFRTIEQHRVDFFEVDEDNEVFIICDKDNYDTDGCKSPMYIGLDELGELTFLTREEAEKALEGLKNEQIC